jgi:membrane-bound lytic murein transglycosylase MltF
LPIPFFANLIWQESRLRDDAVSKKGALGIAQFMPETAAETGLDNPFDPLQAIPASARFLRELRLEFGNLGFVAAAYNAGAHRVAEWLEHRANLPRETRGYVVRVTGLSVDDWRKIAVDDEALTFVRRLPCRSLPAFANVEEAQAEQVRLQQARLEQIKQQQAEADKHAAKHAAKHATKTAAKSHDSHRAVAPQHGRGVQARREAPGRGNGREAQGRAHAVHEKRKSV